MANFTYDVTVTWTGDRGTGTSSYAAYGRDHVLEAGGAPALEGTADPHFRGTPNRWTPEELFVGSISACHQLWYLHLCADAGIVVTSYADRASGTMTTEPGGSGRFRLVTLRPEVRLAAGDAERALALHEEAHRMCFIASSVSVPIACEPRVLPPSA